MNSAQLADMMMRQAGGVGDPHISPRYIGDPHISPRVIGAPLEQMQQPNPQNAVKYGDTQWVSGDVTWFGFGATLIPAGTFTVPGVAVVSLKPLRPITPQKIFCPSTVQGLLIAQANVAGTNIFANQAGVPIELFSEVSTAPQIDWPTIDTSTGIDFTVNNPTAVALVFSGAMYGTALRR